MPVYQITPLANMLATDMRGRLDEAIRRVIQPWDVFDLQGGVGWLVKYPGTAVELSGAIGLTPPPVPPPPLVMRNALANALTPPAPPNPLSGLFAVGSPPPPEGGLLAGGLGVLTGVPPPPPLSALVVAISTYYGFGPADMWQWLERSFSQ